MERAREDAARFLGATAGEISFRDERLTTLDFSRCRALPDATSRTATRS